MRRGEVYRLRIPRDPRGHEQRGARFGIVVQAEELLPLSTVLISPTSASAAPATFRPVIDVDGSPTRVLVEQTFQRVGGTGKVAVDVRIVSSTSRNIEAEIAAGKFREDLYHRLSVVPVRVPPLAERREDIPDLVNYFMEQISLSTGLPQRQIGADAMAVLQSHDWPGNVRQLRNNVERLMILAGGDPSAVISASMLPQDVGSMVPSMPNGNGGEQLMGLPLREARELFEREYLLAQINRFGGNISRTASFIGMERSALHRKLKALGID